MTWPTVPVRIDDGTQAKAIAPYIISASRSTDIPAFYGDWFMRRLDEGYVTWVNPFNRRPQVVSLANARVILAILCERWSWSVMLCAPA